MGSTSKTNPKKYCHEDIADRIAGLIHQEELRTGDRLPAERQLASTFSVSRNCVREAVRTLARKGVLQSRQRHGTYVYNPGAARPPAPPTAAVEPPKERLRDIFAFRKIMEPHAAALAARNISRKQLDRLKILLVDQQRKFLAGKKTAYLNQQFHKELVRASGNSVLIEMARTLDPVFTESHPEQSPTGHRGKASVSAHIAIIDALEHKHPQKAYDATYRHLVEIEDRLLGTQGQTGVIEKIKVSGHHLTDMIKTELQHKTQRNHPCFQL